MREILFPKLKQKKRCIDREVYKKTPPTHPARVAFLVLQQSAICKRARGLAMNQHTPYLVGRCDNNLRFGE